MCWGLVVIEDLGDWNLLYALTHTPHELPATGSWHRKPGAGRLLFGIRTLSSGVVTRSKL